jgi:glycine betaine/proline transport system ATP-binding protein
VLGRVADSRWPVVVLDDNKRYVGAITKTALLQTLDRTG